MRWPMALAVLFSAALLVPASAQTTTSAQLDGSGTFALPALPALGAPFTIEGWVNPRSHASYGRIFEAANGAGTDTILLSASSVTSGRPYFDFVSGGAWGLTLVAPDPIPLNTWTHVAAVLDSDRSARLYINGRLVASGTASSLPPSIARSANFIGKGSLNDPLLNGSVADVRVWSTARTQAQIQAVMPVGSITGATTGLVAAYPFGATGQAVLNDVSGNNRNLTPSGTVLYQTAGPASPLPGPADDVVVADLVGSAHLAMPTLPAMGAPVTLEAWVYPRSVAPWGRIVEIASDGANGANSISLFSSADNSGRPNFTVMTRGVSYSLQLDAPNALPLNAWSHVAAVLDSDRSARLYVNGQLVSSGTASVLPPSVGRTFNVIGKADSGNANTLLADVRVWNTARTPAQVQGAMAGGSITGPATGLVAAYPFGHTGQPNLNDVSGNNRTLTSSGDVQFRSTGPASPRTSSLQLNGSGWAILPALPAMGAPLTVEGWVNPSSHVNWGRLVDVGNGQGNNNIILVASHGTFGRPIFTIFSGGSSVVDLYSPEAIPLNAWTHLAGVLNADRSAQLYINGRLVASGTASSLPPSVTRSSGFIGKSNWAGDTTGFDGSMADVRIWSVGRTQSQIQSSMPVGSIPGSTTGLVAAYPFGATGQAALNDVSGNNRTLASTGVVQFQVLGPSSPPAAASDSMMTANLAGASYLAMPALPAMGAPATLEAWVFPRSVVEWGRLIEVAADANNGASCLLLSTSAGTSGRPNFTVMSRNVTFHLSLDAPNPLPLNAWSHVAAVLNSDRTAQLSVNGQLVVSGTASSLPPSAARTFNLIGTTDARPGDTTVAVVRVWGVGRTEAQIRAAMGVGAIVGPATGLLAAYPLGSSGANVLADVSGNSRDLTQFGSPAYRKTGSGLLVAQGFQGSASLATFAGQLTLPSNNSYSGTTTIGGGVLQVGTGGTAGSLGTGNVVNNGALTFNRSDAVTVANAISGTGGLTQQGAGTVALTGANTYSGVSTVSAGILQVGAGGATGSLGTGNVVNNGTLTFNRSDSVTVANAISGTGNLVNQGTGTIVVTGNNSYAGTTTVAAGTIQAGHGGTTGSLGGGDVVNNGSLVFNRSGDVTVGNAITGSGSVFITGSGTVTLGNARPGGGTIVQGGTLRINGPRTVTGAITVQQGATLRVDGWDSLAYDAPGWSYVTNVAVNGGTVVMAGYNNQAASAVFVLNAGRITGAMNWNLYSAGDVNRAGVTTLASATSSVIDVTTVQLGQQSVTFDVADGAAASDLQVASTVRGTGNLVKTGAGTMAMSGANTYSGTTTVSDGTLALTGSGSFDSSPAVTVAAGATLDTSGRSSALALGASQTLANSGGTALLKGNITATSATLALAATATTPAFAISSGTLTLDASTTLRVTVSGTALAAGTYKLVAKGGSGLVSGVAPASVTAVGAGLASGHGASAQLSNGELLLRVVPVATITLGNLSQVYSGSARTPLATTVPPGLAVAFTYNGSSSAPVAAGSYAVVATINDPSYMGTASGSLVVTKASASMILGNLFQSYDGTVRRVVAATEPPGLSWTATYNGSANAPTNLGLYNVVATITDANYTGFTNGLLTVKVGNPGARPDPTAQPPAYFNQHGYLADASGNPLGSPNPRNYDLVFRIFTVPSGGSSLWAERQVVTVDQGRYDVMLGEGMSHGVEPWPSLDAVLASGAGNARYLEVTVRSLGIGGSDLTLSPRLILPNQPYAFLARHTRMAESLVDSNAIPVVRVSGTSVGIGVEQANAMLHVGSVLTTTAFASEGNTTVTGRYAAASFEGSGTLPVGSIIVWTGGALPEGWALCDGSTVQGRRTPDLRSRFVLGQGQGSGLTSRSVGQVGGAEAYRLTEASFAAHRHVFDPPPRWIGQESEHSHSYTTFASGVGRFRTFGVPPVFYPEKDKLEADLRKRFDDPEVQLTTDLGTARRVSHPLHQHTLSFTSQSAPAGMGRSHPTMPPFYALSFIMRVR